MTTYTIKRGAVNAKPNKTALRFVRSGAAWRVRFNLDTAAGDTGQYQTSVPNTHIKLLGLYWSGWMVWQRMREAWRDAYRHQQMAKTSYLFSYRELGMKPFSTALKAALRQYLAWTHGNSARVNAKWETRAYLRTDDLHDGVTYTEQGEERGVSLSTYYYLGGRGAVTTGSPVAGKEVAWLPEDPDNPGWTVWGEVKMEARETELQVRVKEDSPFGPRFAFKQAADFLSRRPWFFGLCKPHAANGPSSPHAPCDLTFEMERV